jgi:hypothetical protein
MSTGEGEVKWPFFEQMDRVLGCRASSNPPPNTLISSENPPPSSYPSTSSCPLPSPLQHPEVPPSSEEEEEDDPPAAPNSH